MSSVYGGDTGSGYGGEAGSSAYETDSSHPDVDSQSLGSMVTNLSNDLSRLMRQEVALAKAELKDEAAKAGKGVGMLAGAGYAGHMAALFLSLTLMWLLDNVMDVTWAALIVTILWAVAAAVLFVNGRKTLKSVEPKPEQTVESLKEDAQWLKPQKS